MPTLQASDHFQYRQLPSGIHELSLYTADARAFQACFAQLHEIFAHTPPDEPLLLLWIIHQFDIRRLNDLWRLSRTLLIRFPEQRPLYNAVIYHPSRMLSSLMMVMSQLASIFNASIYFCHAGEEQKAIAWLLEREREKS